MARLCGFLRAAGDDSEPNLITIHVALAAACLSPPASLTDRLWQQIERGAKSQR